MADEHGVGRPRKELDPAKVEALAALQCTYDEIASALCVSTDTLERRRKECPEIADAIKRGREQGTTSLRRLQWKAAESGNVTMQIWLGKQWLKQTDKHEIDQKTKMTFNFDPARKPEVIEEVPDSKREQNSE